MQVPDLSSLADDENALVSLSRVGSLLATKLGTLRFWCNIGLIVRSKTGRMGRQKRIPRGNGMPPKVKYKTLHPNMRVKLQFVRIGQEYRTTRAWVREFLEKTQ